MIHVNPSIKLGNQKWNGAAPLFSNNADNKIIEINDPLISLFILFFNISKITANNKTVEANAWVKKYFNEASVDLKLLWFSLIRGIKDNKLISNPIQAPNQELDVTVIKEPIIIIIKNKIFEELLKIKKKRIKTFINGVWAQ